MNKLAIIIPAFNEAPTIRDVAKRALREVPWTIVVDDGSTDGTAKMVEGLPVTLLCNGRNCGKAASLARGMDHAFGEGAEAVIALDGDGQHRPEDIPRLLRAFERDRNAVVIGSRLHDRDRIPWDRYLANRLANFWIAWAAGQPIADSQSGYRIYPAALAREFIPQARRDSGFVFESEFLIEAGRRGVPLVSVPISAVYPERARRSHFRPVLDIARITRGLFFSGLIRSLRGSAWRDQA